MHSDILMLFSRVFWRPRLFKYRLPVLLHCLPRPSASNQVVLLSRLYLHRAKTPMYKHDSVLLHAHVLRVRVCVYVCVCAQLGLEQ